MAKEVLDVVIPLLCCMGVPGTIGLLLWHTHRQEREARQSLVAKYGWTLTHGTNLEGLYKGRKFSLRTERRGPSRSKKTVYVLQLALPSVMRNVALKSEGIGDKFLKMLGSDEEELRDAELDDALHLKQVTPEARAVLRDPLVRRRFLAMSERFRSASYWAGFSISGGLFEAEFKPGTLDTPKRMNEAVSLVLNLADALDEAARRAAPSHAPRG